MSASKKATAPNSGSTPRLILNKNVRHRILQGHPWVFASEVERLEGVTEDLDTIEIRTYRGEFLGSALFNPKSQIIARQYSREARPLDAALIRERLLAAVAYRAQLNSASEKVSSRAKTAQRLVWSESDRLPGLIVDRYGDVVVLQTLTLAMSRRQDLIASLLHDITKCRVLLARNDAQVRKLEGLPLERTVLQGTYQSPVTITIAGIDYDLDVWTGQKTGFYLDQVTNYTAVARYAKGRRVLDCFTNQGAFALSCLRAGAISCRALDQSAEALKAAAATAGRAGLKAEWIEINVFDCLPIYERQREQFDLIILDPPSFTKTKDNKSSALRGYHELHLRAVRLLAPGGILATFSCSHHVNSTDWEELLGKVSTETHTPLRLRERLAQSPDHPVLVNVPETEYLHGYVVEKI